MNITNKSIWIMRDVAKIPNDMEHYIERHPEDSYLYAKLYIYYDNPESGMARKMCEVPNYMFPEIKEGMCVEFKSYE